MPIQPMSTRSELMDYPCIVYEQNADSPGFFSEEMMLPNFYPRKVVYISDLYVSTALMRSCNAYDIGTGVISPRLAREVASSMTTDVWFWLSPRVYRSSGGAVHVGREPSAHGKDAGG